jgi:hypothetical protein
MGHIHRDLGIGAERGAAPGKALKIVFRDSPAADRAVEEMLAREYLPRLIRSRTR